MPHKTNAAGVKVWQLRNRNEQLFRWFLWLLAVMAFVVSWNRISEQTTWFFVYDAPRIAADIGGRAWPPRWSYITQLGKPIWDTLNIATLGTIIALCLAVPVAFLAARNTSPAIPIHPFIIRQLPKATKRLLRALSGGDLSSIPLIRPFALLIIVSSRSINSLIWALLLVSIVGPGVFAGLLAISIRSIGFCAKLLYEAIEEIDETQVEAISATGASGWQVMVYGIVPQILPAFAGIAVFRWDINIRESTVLGLVGAGGIGLQLQSSLNVLAWPQVALILLVILVAVIIGEWVSAKVRAAII
jgi:phosphonate transport system permease protein